jgi:hypothetical protein
MRRFSLLVLLLLCWGCREDAVEPPWEENPDTTWVGARLEEYFTELTLEDSGTLQRGLYDDSSGIRFSRKARLQLAYAARKPSSLRVVVESRSTGASVGSWGQDVTGGTGAVQLGTFLRDLYTLHAFVSGSRIVVIPFAAE